MSQTTKPSTEHSARQATSTRSENQAPARKLRRPEPREGSTIWAAIEVLRGKRKPMSVAEIYTEIRER